ncbi:MAG: hypothetical protein ABL958_10900 [Bdellovibrionia bacterium]
MIRFLVILIATIQITSVARGAQADAERLSETTQAYHLPYNLIFGFLTSDPSNYDILFYDDAGDSALWTGLYLAAEAFRYNVTKDERALTGIRRALDGIDTLSRASGDGYLARSIFKVDGPFVDHYKSVEGGYGLRVFQKNGEDYYWQDRTTRDQYAGVFFGLAAAYDLVDDQDVKNVAADIITRLTDYLLKNGWTTWHFGKASTTFIQMPQQRLSMMKVASHVNPKFKKQYESMRWWAQNFADTPIWIQGFNEHSSYFKFNLEYLYIYNLVRLEPANKAYKKAYGILRKVTADHLNPHFNMIDREASGPNGARDQETRDMLVQRLARGFRDQSVDLTGKYKECDGRACEPIPVHERPFDGFMWQRSPFTLKHDGDPRVEHAGIDYMLPYWMARYYGVVND